MADMPVLEEDGKRGDEPTARWVFDGFGEIGGLSYLGEIGGLSHLSKLR